MIVCLKRGFGGNSNFDKVFLYVLTILAHLRGSPITLKEFTDKTRSRGESYM
jgi:hypothetical protein